MTHCVFQKTLWIIFEQILIISSTRRINLVAVSTHPAAHLPYRIVSHMGAGWVNMKIVGFSSKNSGGMYAVAFPIQGEG